MRTLRLRGQGTFQVSCQKSGRWHSSLGLRPLRPGLLCTTYPACLLCEVSSAFSLLPLKLTWKQITAPLIGAHRMLDGAGAGHYRPSNQPFSPANGSQSMLGSPGHSGARAMELWKFSAFPTLPAYMHTHIHMPAHADTHRYSHTETYMHNNQFLWSPK